MATDPFDKRQIVQYLGEDGFTQTCILAVNAILNSGILPEKATIVSFVYDRRSHPRQEDHLLIFWNWQYMPVVVIPSGFASGYGGEGPRGFELALCLIREKSLPMDMVFLGEDEFKALTEANIKYADHPLFKKIKIEAEPATWPWYDWVSEEIEEFFEQGVLLKHRYLNGYEKDLVTQALTEIALVNQEVAAKLRHAKNNVEKSSERRDWQSALMYIRDTWIEFSMWLCETLNIDTVDIEKDKVVEKLRRIEPIKSDEKLFNLARGSFGMSMKHHDRTVEHDDAVACVISSIVTIKAIIQEVF